MTAHCFQADAHITSTAQPQWRFLCASYDEGAKGTWGLIINTVTHSSSDSSSPDGKLTSSSSSSPAFLLRDDIVKCWLQKLPIGQNGGIRKFQNVGFGTVKMRERWRSKKEKRKGDGRLRGRGQLGGVVAVGWCGEQEQELLCCRAGRARAMHETEASASNAWGLWGAWVWERAWTQERALGRGGKEGGEGPRGESWRGGGQADKPELGRDGWGWAGLDCLAWEGSGELVVRCEEVQGAREVCVCVGECEGVTE